MIFFSSFYFLYIPIFTQTNKCILNIIIDNFLNIIDVIRENVSRKQFNLLKNVRYLKKNDNN